MGSFSTYEHLKQCVLRLIEMENGNAQIIAATTTTTMEQKDRDVLFKEKEEEESLIHIQLIQGLSHLCSVGPPHVTIREYLPRLVQQFCGFQEIHLFLKLYELIHFKDDDKPTQESEKYGLLLSEWITLFIIALKKSKGSPLLSVTGKLHLFQNQVPTHEIKVKSQPLRPVFNVPDLLKPETIYTSILESAIGGGHQSHKDDAQEKQKYQTERAARLETWSSIYTQGTAARASRLLTVKQLYHNSLWLAHLRPKRPELEFMRFMTRDTRSKKSASGLFHGVYDEAYLGQWWSLVIQTLLAFVQERIGDPALSIFYLHLALQQRKGIWGQNPEDQMFMLDHLFAQPAMELKSMIYSLLQPMQPMQPMQPHDEKASSPSATGSSSNTMATTTTTTRKEYDVETALTYLPLMESDIGRAIQTSFPEWDIAKSQKYVADDSIESQWFRILSPETKGFGMGPSKEKDKDERTILVNQIKTEQTQLQQTLSLNSRYINWIQMPQVTAREPEMHKTGTKYKNWMYTQHLGHHDRIIGPFLPSERAQCYLVFHRLLFFAACAQHYNPENNFALVQFPGSTEQKLSSKDSTWIYIKDVNGTDFPIQLADFNRTRECKLAFMHTLCSLVGMPTRHFAFFSRRWDTHAGNMRALFEWRPLDGFLSKNKSSELKELVSQFFFNEKVTEVGPTESTSTRVAQKTQDALDRRILSGKNDGMTVKGICVPTPTDHATLGEWCGILECSHSRHVALGVQEALTRFKLYSWFDCSVLVSQFRRLFPE
jgi:hypothetical protein